ncbi:DUF262 domain-containing protein [Bacteroides acidifaciens]|uniref:DUF262 domain-containing protein n=1 Tax=Bacteroides acidifaciens TaxID=85831 RepID=UPI002599DC88|nr:DUF262 domain-containing protein [Bacteroides acidifaciens]
MKTTTFKALISNNNEYGINGITIPRIQRSYAQGRADAHAVKTRNRFLSAIQSGLIGNGLTLDFIYGNIQNGQLIPLDGQQRLTTLWLLHWYAAKKENITNNNLAHFTYNTRYSARDFITKLVVFKPSLKETLSNEIRNQGWFPMEWDNDPTVSGMLTMLDEIQKRFSNTDNLWSALDKIDFYFRDIEEMKLTDDIYIKMNSRGKPLTDFEHFKAELLKVIRSDNGNEGISKRIGLKIDRDWTDLIWNYRDTDNLVDNGILRLFRFVSLIIIYKSNHSASEFDLTDDFNLLDHLYKGHPENVEFLELTFDLLFNVHRKTMEQDQDSLCPVGEFFENYLLLPHDHQQSKVVVPQQITHIDIFKAILDNVALRRNTPYWIVMFYSFLLYLKNQEVVADSDFRRRLRVVVNLLKNSKNEVVDTPNGDAGNRIPAILQQVESIILNGVIADSVMIYGEQRQNFNAIQLEEERQKLIFTTEHPEYSESLFQLEDFYLLEGRVDIVGYENTHLYQHFITLFTSCSRDAIDCAMLSITNYSQRLNSWCIQLGSSDEGDAGNKAWHALFHPSGKNLEFNNTKKALRTILDTYSKLDDIYLTGISDKFLNDCRAKNQYDWRYYYIAYPCFRPERFGKYTMYDNQPYSIVALHAEKRESSKAYQCMLQALIEDQAVANSAEWYDTRNLTYKKGLLTCEEDAFVSYSMKDHEERGRFSIPQNEEKIDTVDRIAFFKEHRKDEDMWTLPEE